MSQPHAGGQRPFVVETPIPIGVPAPAPIIKWIVPAVTPAPVSSVNISQEIANHSGNMSTTSVKHTGHVSAKSGKSAKNSMKINHGLQPTPGYAYSASLKKNIKVTPGDTGMPGPPGRPGPPGGWGHRGTLGARGPRGPAGPTGPDGHTGKAQLVATIPVSFFVYYVMALLISAGLFFAGGWYMMSAKHGFSLARVLGWRLAGKEGVEHMPTHEDHIEGLDDYLADHAAAAAAQEDTVSAPHVGEGAAH